MAQENSNSTMEMGTSDQVLVSTKKTKPITYIIGFAAMLVAIGIAITLVVVLSGNEGGVAEPIVSTTPVVPTDPTESTMAPTVPITAPSTTAATTVPTTDSTTATAPTTTEIPEIPPPDQIEVEDVINGLYSPASFNGSWSADNRVLFRNSNGDLVLYDVDSLTFTPLIANTSEILQQSSRVTQLSADGSQVLLAYSVAPVYRYSFIARYAAIDLSGNVTEILPPNLARSTDGFLQNVVWGPSGTSLAYVYLNNIFYQSSLDSTPQQITTSGQLNVVYNGIPDWVYEEEVFVSSNAMWFSADGNKLAYVTFNDTNVRIMRVPHYGVPGSVEYQYTRHHEIHYPKPGTTNPTVTVTLRNIVNNEDSVYEAPTDLNEPILKAVRFVTNEAIALLWSDRAQTSMIVQLCGPTSTCTQIYQYNEPNGWIDNIPLLFNREGNSFITILPQAVDGVLFKQIVQVSNVNANSWTATGRTNTAHTVVDILLWTDDDIIWYKATHVNDSAAQHLYSVDSSRSVACFSCNITRTDGQECVYNDATMSSDGTKVTLNCAGPGVPQTFIYDISGSRVLTWDTNEEISTLVDQRSTPTTLRLSFPVADGLPEADVLLHLPSDYEQRTNIPLLVYVYGGPDTALVTKQWSIDWGSSLVARWGVALAHIDARGSGLRGVNNMFAVNRRLGTVEIDDQINVTRQLQQLPWLDSNRTCIWGWSYGGYAASLALARGGDVFRCAAAVAPVVDWRFYDTIYTERYMDTPQNNQVGYSQSSLLSEEVAAAYRNKSYFLIHGTADDNVHYQHAMLFSRLLQRRDVAFTQMSYTDEDHGLVGVRPHLYHALEKFLGENML